MINLHDCLVADHSELTKGGRFYGIALTGNPDDLHHAYCHIMEQSRQDGSELQIFYHRPASPVLHAPVFNPKGELTYLVVMSPKPDSVLGTVFLAPMYDNAPITLYSYKVSVSEKGDYSARLVYLGS